METPAVYTGAGFWTLPQTYFKTSQDDKGLARGLAILTAGMTVVPLGPKWLLGS